MRLAAAQADARRPPHGRQGRVQGLRGVDGHARLGATARVETTHAQPKHRYYYYNSQTGSTSWTKPLLLGSQDIQDGKLVGSDGRLLADDTYESDYTEDSSDADRSQSSSGSDEVDSPSEQEDESDDSDEGSIMPREWPRSVSQRRVDAAEDDPDAAALDLSALGLPRLTFRALSVDTLTSLNVSDNRLERLQKDVGGLFNLQILDVSGNRLRTLPQQLEDLDQLRVLNCARNAIQWHLLRRFFFIRARG